MIAAPTPWPRCRAGVLAVAWLAAALAWSPLAAGRDDAGRETLVIVARHAEKAPDAGDDPALDGLGKRRARFLAGMLADAGITGIYVTPYRRTRETAAPLAERLGLEIRERPIPGGDVADYSQSLARELIEAHAGEAVLVVGHSNTVSELVEALSGQRPEPPDEEEYGRVWLVLTTAAGHGRVVEAGYPDLGP